MEEWGWIDKNQKGMLKDLIISGNQVLQTALDKFNSGDSAELQGSYTLTSYQKIIYIPFYSYSYHTGSGEQTARDHELHEAQRQPGQPAARGSAAVRPQGAAARAPAPVLQLRRVAAVVLHDSAAGDDGVRA